MIAPAASPHPAAPAPSIAHLTDQSFDAEVVASERPVLVDFSAVTCAPCRALEPVIRALAETYSGRVRFVEVDIDSCQRVAARYGIRSVPTLLLFQRGRVVAQLVGAGPSTRARLVAALDKALAERT